MKMQADRNKRVFGAIEFYNYLVVNKTNGNKLTILASDAPSNIGLKFNLLLINDFVDWKHQEFFEVLLSATGKIPGVKIWVESNAGKRRKGYKWKFREYARREKDWFFRTTKKWLASWTPQAWFREQQALLSQPAYRRLIGNEWIENVDTFLSVDQVAAITKIGLTPSMERPEDVEMVATATDLGISKAAAAVGSVGYVKGNKPLRLLDLRVFPGSEELPVQIVEVENAIEDQLNRYDSDAVIVDPWNMRKTIQDREFEWPLMEFTFSPAHIMHLTSDVFRRVVNRQLEIYPNAGPAIQNEEQWDLQRELSTAIIRQMSYGERIDHKRSGYTDRIISVGMALWWLGQSSFPKDRREFSVKIV